MDRFVRVARTYIEPNEKPDSMYWSSAATLKDQARAVELAAIFRAAAFEASLGPIPMLIFCPACAFRHIDEGEWAVKPHHTHACQECGFVWRPAIVPTVGVHFLPGFKDGES